MLGQNLEAEQKHKKMRDKKEDYQKQQSFLVEFYGIIKIKRLDMGGKA